MNIKILILFKVNGLAYYLKKIKIYAAWEMMINPYIVGEVQK